jgi:hypothetical protein
MPGVLPQTLKYLKMHARVKYELNDDILPASLEEICLLNYNHPLHIAKLNSLKVLDLGFYFNNDFTLPTKLIKLALGHMFNLPLNADSLPDSIEILDFGGDFNQPITKLPSSLKCLELGFEYNHPIDVSVLPSSLVRLNLGHEFNHPINGDVSHLTALTDIFFGMNFDQDIENLINSLPAISYLKS